MAKQFTIKEFKKLKNQYEKETNKERKLNTYNNWLKKVTLIAEEHVQYIQDVIKLYKVNGFPNDFHETCYDMEDDLVDFLDVIESDKLKRKWSKEDHKSYELILQNID